MAANEGADLLDQIIEQAATIYGDGFVLPDEDQHTAFLTRGRELTDNPPRLIAELLDFLENPNTINAGEVVSDDQEAHIGGPHGQEIHDPGVDRQEIQLD